jgi:hypothetical protein
LPVAFEVQRIPNPLAITNAGLIRTSGTNFPQMGDAVPAGWPLNPEVCYDANPANILYDLLTNVTYGLGVPTENIDTVSFYEAGQILTDEYIGMSILIDQQGTFDDITADILKTIDGVFFCDPRTGKFTLRLIRDRIDDAKAIELGLTSGYYNKADLPEFGEDDIIGDPEYTRGSWGDVANEIRVQYVDRDSDYSQRVVYVHDPANRAAQGETVSVQNTYNGITSGWVALMLAYRDLRAVGYPRARLKVIFNKKAWALRPGDVFIFNYPTIGIVGMRMRVGNARYGDPIDPRIEIEAIEDVFALAETIYTDPGSGWVDPASVDPVAPIAVRMWEPPYPMMADAGTTRRGMSVLIVRGDEYTTGGELWGGVQGKPLQKIGDVIYTASAMLSQTLGWIEREDTITIQGGTDSFLPDGTAKDGRNLALVGNELIAFDEIGRDDADNVILAGCLRGVMDTIPRPHSSGERVWLVRVPLSMAQTDNPAADRTEMARVVASNAKGTLDVYTQPIYSGSTNSRQIRPLVPGRFRVESDDLATTVTDRIIAGDVDVSWEKRNRLTQAPGVVAQDDPSVDPEANQESRIVVRQGLWMWDPYLPESMGGGPFPFGEWVRFEAPGTIMDDWALFPGYTQFYGGVGLREHLVFNEGMPTYALVGSGTAYIYMSLDGIVSGVGLNFGAGTLGYSYTNGDNHSGRIYLFRWDFQADGAAMLYKLTDIRPPVVPTEIMRSLTATSHAVTPEEIVSVNAIGPFQIVLDSIRGGSPSWEQRESGLIFPAGWGMSWGLHWGGTIEAPPSGGGAGWGLDWGLNWNGIDNG